MQPIITSLLDLDYYKLTMGQLVWHRYRDTPVVYGFTNRTNRVRLADSIPERQLRTELDHVRSLRFTAKELQYLARHQCGQRPMFDHEYLDWLAGLQLPKYELSQDNGTYRLQFPGTWSQAIYWETLALSIINDSSFSQSSSPRLVGGVWVGIVHCSH